VKDKALGSRIKAMMSTPALVACGDTSLKQLGALFEGASLVVANDTGSMHIAVSVGAPVIALFGPTDPALTGPYGEGSYRVISRQESCDVPCYDLLCKDNRCMAAISVEDVLSASDEIFGKKL
jgi:ADP-heptose:LPS heptosyltransferase